MAIDPSVDSTVDTPTVISDDEFDSLLATMPLSGFPSQLASPSTQNAKRKTQHTSPKEDDNPTDQVYEPIRFGEISKYMTNKRKKLKLQESALRDHLPSHSTPPQIFTGTIIHVNGYTNPPLSELRNMIILHGGTYMAYLDHKSVITHIIASTLTPKKRQEFRNYKVIKPEWIVKSISTGRLLNWSDFRLMGLRTPTEDNIAKGEITGGHAVAQKTLFNLSKASLSTLSIQSSSKVSSQTQVQLSHPSIVRKGRPPNRPCDPLQSSVQSTFKSLLTTSSDEASLPGSIVDSSNNNCSPTASLSLIPSGPTSHAYQPPKSHFHDPQCNLPSSENHGVVTNMSTILCTDPDFIQQYFQQSRLHHLSTWKADLLQTVSILSEKKEPSSVNLTGSKKKIRGDPSDKRVIMHVDFDCFFISAALIGRPELKGKPLAVCHAKAYGSGKPNTSTSEIASCSYEARAFGVRNGQTLGKAQRLCPEIQTIPYEFELYEKLSLKFYNILLSYADELQAVSVDECLIDVSSRFANQLSPLGFDSMEPNVLKFAEEIRATIRQSTKCEASIGISYNVLLAKLATKKAKPCGSFFLSSNQVQPFLNELSVDQLPGFGWSQKNEIEQKLPSVQNVGDIRSIPLSRLMEVLGPARGKTLHQYAYGTDERSLKSTNHERKSVSAVINYGIRFRPTAEGGNDEVQKFLLRLGLEVSRRLTELDVVGRQLTLKVMKRAPNAPIEPSKYMGHGICEESSKSTKLSGPAGAGVSDGKTLGIEAWKLLQPMSIQPEDLRGIGIQINLLDKRVNADKHKPKVQLTLPFPTTKAVAPPARPPGPQRENKVIHSANQLGIVESRKRTPIPRTSKRTSITTLHPTPFVIPPASQLDLNVVNELPACLKTHILNAVTIAPKPKDNNAPIDNHERNAVSIDLITPQKNSDSIKFRQRQNYHGLPSASQVDWKLLAELPSSVRKPIEAIYKNQKKHPRYHPPPTPPNFTGGLKKVTRRGLGSPVDIQERFSGLHIKVSNKQRTHKKTSLSHRVAPMGPSQKLINKKTFKLVTQKIQPKSSGEGKKVEEEEELELLPTPNKISDEQLEALEIDPRFFRELNDHGHSSVTRAFQLDLIWNQFQLNSVKFKQVTNMTDRWKKWRKNFDRPNKKVLEIKLPEPPTIGSKQDGKGLNKLEDILELIEDWVHAHSSHNNIVNNHPLGMAREDDNDGEIAPLVQVDERDIDIIETFLIDSIDSHSNATMGQDFEKVTKIIQWWEYLILSTFLACADSNPNRITPISWKTYWERIIDRAKAKINLVAIRDFGAPIY